MLKDLLEGKPLRHPLHPLLVHFPIGLLALSLLLDLAGWLFPSVPTWVRGAFYAMVAGVVTALLAAIPGFVDYIEIRRDHPGRNKATTHLVLNLVAVGLYAVNLGLRSSVLDAPSIPLPPLILSLIGIGLLSVSGYLGGYLVYDDGIGVGRHRRHTATPVNTLRFSTASLPEPERMQATRYVAVGDAGRLAEGETWRVEIDGLVIAVAKRAGTLHAVQEFCTHRFGPLSEGSFRDGQVECPWHRSCFDLHTGKVTQGPAKVDLRVFPVEIRDGKIRVGIPRPPPEQSAKEAG